MLLLRRTNDIAPQRRTGTKEAPNDRLPGVFDINWINIQDEEHF